MEASTRRRAVTLAALLAVLAVVGIYQWRRGPAEAGTAASNRAESRGTAGAGRPAARIPEAGSAVQDVKLEELSAPKPGPGAGARNPFRFQAKAPPRPIATEPATPGPSTPLPPPPPPGPPPITLKFIGIVDAPGQAGKLAVLSDGRNVSYGKEGDIIEGRYVILRIGVESIEMAYADGRGRQTIRLSGQ